MALRRRSRGIRSRGGSIYQLRIALKHIRPPIWRRVLVPGDVSLYTLHEVIQAVIPWQSYHLYMFTIGDTEYGEPSPDDWQPVKDVRRARLSQVVPGEGAKFRYTYDFGDDWEHEIVVEKVLSPDPHVRYPVCIEGRRAGPPEDCGGPWGYPDLLEILQNPEHEEYEEMLEWVGGEFDPEAFDLEDVNQALEHVRKKR